MQILRQITQGISPLVSWKGYMIMAVATIAFANVVLAIFGSTIPNVFLMVFGNTIPGTLLAAFRVAAGSIMLILAFLFVLAWLLRAKPHGRPRAYRVIVFDVYGGMSPIDGLRLKFRNHDVAWSHMKQYKESYPLFNFALVSDNGEERPTIYRYI